MKIDNQIWTFSICLTGFDLVLGTGWCSIMVRTAGPLETILSEIEKAIEARLFYLAVAMALTLPDICAALEDPRGYSGKREYEKWYDANLSDKFVNMSASDCYSLRCGVVHKGSLGLKSKGSFTRVLFTLPTTNNIVFHNCVANDALQFDAVLFCRDVASAVRQWYDKAESDVSVVSNLPNLLRFRVEGLPPYMVGMPLIG